jgi:hypothetical protein
MRFLVSLLLAVVLGCSKTSPPGTGMDWNDLYQHWTHSYEEQQDPNGPERIYRPAGSREFPPNFYRHQYIFRENGEAEWLWPSPADAHEMRATTWRIDPQRADVIHIQEGDNLVSYRVLDLSRDRLVLLLLGE